LLKIPALANVDTRAEEAFISFLLGLVSISDRKKYFEKSLSLYAELHDQVDIIDMLFLRAWILFSLADIRELLTQNLAQIRQSRDPERIMRSLIALAWLDRADGKYREAFQKYNEAYEASCLSRNALGMALALSRSAWLYNFLGEFDRAYRCYAECLKLCQPAGSQQFTGAAYIEMGVTEMWQGHLSKAIVLIEKGRTFMQQPPIRDYYYDSLFAYVNLHAGYDRISSKFMRKDIDYDLWKSYCLQSWLALKEGHFEDALADSQQKLKSFHRNSEEYAMAQVPYGFALHGLGRNKQAKKELFETLMYCMDSSAFIPLMHLMPILPIVLADCQDQALQERALELYAMAKTLPFVANSRLFKDIAEKPLQEATAQLPQDVILTAQSRGQKLDWWSTAEMLLKELHELGWAGSTPESEFDTTKRK
jgi:tetratricopeptide (TPR) repeat protein